ncbi:MAG TPA: MerR family transcriptional regulator [Planctomycetota bacterium]|nr:MerR family transcriptional regulator [Planctomycetota bacterium]
MAERSGPALFKVGELSKRSGCSRRQIQDYLVIGLIREEGTTPGGQHLFGDRTVRRLQLIRRVLASGEKEYTMAELVRTFRRFLKVLLLAVSLAWAAAALPAAGSGAPAAEPAAAPGSAALTAADRAAIRQLFDSLADAFRKGEADRIRTLLSPSMPPARIEAIFDKLQAEFNSYVYTDFRCELLPADDIEVLGPGRARAAVIIRWEYEDRGEPDRTHADPVGQAFEFELARDQGGWRIAGEDFFDRLSASQDSIFTRIFLWTAIGLVVFSFWGWMLLDACFREWAGRRGPWVIAMVLALLAGLAAVIVWRSVHHGWLLAVAPAPAAAALVYFFAVWMRQGQED